MINWKYKRGLKNNNCLKIYFAFDKRIQRRKKYYLKKYGVLPNFKAGIHGGILTVTEVGVVKKEIAYHGDVINTCSRIQEECNTYGVSLLISDDIFKEIALQENTGLLTVAFLTSLFLMANGVNAIFNGFERSYHSELNRGFFRQYAVAIGVSIVLVLFLFIGVVLSGVVEYWIAVLRARDFMTQDSMEIWLKLIRYITLITMLFLFICTLYYTGTKEGRTTKFLSIGALVTTVLILIFSYLYGIYIDNFSSYNEIYGSIGALLILMVYIWLNANLLLLGFELNASLRTLKARNLKTT